MRRGITPMLYIELPFRRRLAILTADDRLAMPGRPNTSAVYHLDRKAFSLAPDTKLNPELTDDTIAFCQAANRLYCDENYFPVVAPPRSPLPPSDRPHLAAAPGPRTGVGPLAEVD